MSAVDDWTTLLENNSDLAGGDLEFQADNMVYRGPIESVSIVPDPQVPGVSSLSFRLGWLAMLDRTRASEWQASDSNPSEVLFRLLPGLVGSPQHIGEGRITFGTATGYLVVIFPRGGSKLSPDRVSGLNV